MGCMKANMSYFSDIATTDTDFKYFNHLYFECVSLAPPPKKKKSTSLAYTRSGPFAIAGVRVFYLNTTFPTLSSALTFSTLHFMDRHNYIAENSRFVSDR